MSLTGKKIGILGPTSQLGSALMCLLPTAEPIFKSQCNFLSPTSLSTALGEGGWDYLINCAAITDVDWAEEHEAETMTVNNVAVRELARYCPNRKIHLIHISTDYVFDGLDGPYNAKDNPNPLQVYGKSKLEAEDSIREEMRQFTIIRTSNLFGTALGRKNFIEKMIGVGAAKGEIKPNNWRIMVPTSTKALAEKIVANLRTGLPIGLFHSVCGTGASQTDIAAFIFQNIPSLSHTKISGQDKAKSTPVRPPNPSLISSADWELPDWRLEVMGYLLTRGYSRPLFVQEVEADAEFSMGKVWEKLGRVKPDIPTLVAALRADRTNFLLGPKPKKAPKKSISDIMGVKL